MPMSDRKVSDLVKIAQAIWLPSGDRIFLSMDDPFGRDERRSILDIPSTPPKKKKP